MFQFLPVMHVFADLLRLLPCISFHLIQKGRLVLANMKGRASLERVATGKGVPRSGDPGLGPSLIGQLQQCPKHS